jgi:ABC-type amino acid transport system permease subunit
MDVLGVSFDWQFIWDNRQQIWDGFVNTMKASAVGVLGAFAIGLVHGMGGSAGVGVLIVASVSSTWLAVLSLVLLAAFTAVSMTILSTGFGLTLVSRPVRAAFNGVAPSLALASLAFGLWYGTAAWGVAPYPF